MTDAAPPVTGSRLERCGLAAAFLLSETTQDAAVAASALVAFQLFGGYAESLFIVIVMVMLLIGCQLSHVVGRRGWTVVLGGAAVCGAAGLALMAAALSPGFGPRNAAALALAGSCLLGAHRAAHMLYRFAALEIGGVACMGEVFAAATLGGLLGPQLLIDLGLQKGLLAAAAAQLVAGPLAVAFATRDRDAATAADRASAAAAESGRSITAALRQLRDNARDDAMLRLALIGGVVSWAIMLLVTVPAAAIAVASFKMSTVSAIRSLQVHDFLMNAPGPATAAVVERSGPRAAIIVGLVIYVVCVGGFWGCGSDDAFYPAISAGGRGEAMVQRTFFGLIAILALGWNLMWLASTSALDAAARAGGATSPAEIAQIRTANEFCIYSASVAFLLVSMVARDRYKDVVLISAPFLVAVAVAVAQVKTPAYGVVETELA